MNISQESSVGGSGYTFDSAYTMTGGRLGYRTNGNEVFLHDITMNVEAVGVTLDMVDETLTLNAPRITGDWEVGAIRYSNNPLNHGVSVDFGNGQPLPSYGSLSGSYELSSSAALTAGGRTGEGLRIDNETVTHSASFLYREDGQALALRDITGAYRINDLRLDVAADSQNRPALALGFYPAYEFELDGHMTLGAGGASGEGITISSDVRIRDGRAAIIAVPYDEGNGEVPQKGLWIMTPTFGT